MPIMVCDMRRAIWGGDLPGSFTPYPDAKIVWSGPKDAYKVRSTVPNPTHEDDAEETPIAAVRLFVGFAVGPTATWSINDVVAMVRQIREAQGARPDATFVAQKGMYSYREEGAPEDGCQIVIVNMPDWGVPPTAFKKQMQNLGEELCRRLQQELIFGEWQLNGIAKQSWKITP